ncbi:TetR/AcrR family transcriptional regulator [Actinoallomurus rhizosphaericola]|uniref:TetR/AcrR family transcriptional regulator n=1 Tax=Actinoallomurus rhizosphaericola TaxID=2952536 RepID=UPI0020924B77|nr:TetR/AcrR family transcriptional regulator [Actinoallomurus rhizosphaericola]MCO5998934.1 TetR/AcrR family transcriptional regulator [Actinoallomurus rhizosphaericola]
METKKRAPRGREAEAARNDRTILDAARTVFIRDPEAPISAVAEEAGVGVGALYRRYSGKEELLRTLCEDGLHRFIAIAESAPARHDDPWEAFETFVREVIDSDVHSLTVHLAGTFAPTPELRSLAVQASTLAALILDRAKTSGAVRADVDANDLPMIFDQITAIRLGDADRTAALRRRYLTPLLDALRADTPTRPLPGPPPSDEEVGARWRHTGSSPSLRKRPRR